MKMAFDKIKVANPIVEMDGLFSSIFFFFFTFIAWDDAITIKLSVSISKPSNSFLGFDYDFLLSPTSDHFVT